MLENHDTDLDELLEAYLDGDLSDVDAQRMARRLERDPDARRRLAAAERVRSGLRSLPRQSCPPRIENEVLAYARRQEARPWNRLAEWLHRLISAPDLRAAPWQGALVGAALLLVLAVGLRSTDLGSLDSPTLRSPSGTLTGPAAGSTAGPSVTAATGDLSPQEVAAAEQDVKLALAYLGKLGRTASGSVRDLSLRTVTGKDVQAVHE